MMDGRSLIPLLKRMEAGRATARSSPSTKPSAREVGTCQFGGILPRALNVEHSRVFDPGAGQCVPTDQVERYQPRRTFSSFATCASEATLVIALGTQSAANLESRCGGGFSDCAGIEGLDPRVGGRPYCE